MKLKIAILCLTVGVLLAGAVVVHANVPDGSTGEITACLNGEHAVRIIDPSAGGKCEGSENQTSWLTHGGALIEDQTAAGQKLTTGATIAKLELSPGDYIVTGKTHVTNLGISTINYVQCGLTGLAVSENARATLGANAVQTLVVLGSVAIEEPTAIEFFCGASNAEAAFTVLTATSVSSITTE